MCTSFWGNRQKRHNIPIAKQTPLQHINGYFGVQGKSLTKAFQPLLHSYTATFSQGIVGVNHNTEQNIQFSLVQESTLKSRYPGVTIFNLQLSDHKGFVGEIAPALFAEID